MREAQKKSLTRHLAQAREISEGRKKYRTQEKNKKNKITTLYDNVLICMENKEIVQFLI